MTDSGHRTHADWARAYRERGWASIPLKPNEKAPENAGWQTQRIGEDQVDAIFTVDKNIGLLLGPPSGNLLDIDLDCAETVRLAPHFLQKTGTVFGRPSKPKSHYLYQADPSQTVRRVTFDDPDGTLLLEIRGEGHQTMVPPSMHPDREQLLWSSFGAAGQTSVTDLEKRAGWLAAAAMLGRHWPQWEHRRHFIVMHLSGAMLRAGVPIDQVRQFVKAVCLVGGENDWADREAAIDSTAEKLESENAVVSGFPKLAEVIGDSFVKKLIDWLKLPRSGRPQGDLTDTGNAERLAKRHGDDLMYCGPHGKWYVWDGARYAIDDTGAVVEKMVETARSIFDEAKEAPEDNRPALAKFAVASLNRSRIDAAIALARSKAEIAVVPDNLDRDIWFLNVKNGTVNLMTGGLQLHDRRDHETRPRHVRPERHSTCLGSVHRPGDGRRSGVDRVPPAMGGLLLHRRCVGTGLCLSLWRWAEREVEVRRRPADDHG